jgi:hypothetical protein
MTMTHLQDEDLVLHYYGEMSEDEERHAGAHLAACAACHASYTRLQRVLAVVDTLPAPDLPESFERTTWARLAPNLPARRRSAWSWFGLSPAGLVWAAAVVVLVAGAFLAGRLFHRDAEAPTEARNVPNQVRERILLVDLGDHLDRSQMVLVELVSADERGSVDISTERARAEQLVAANRLYRETAAATGDTAVTDLLDELERVLVDVAASPERMSSQELDQVRRRIESRGLLFKVRVVSSEVRERQNAAAHQRGT